MIVCCISSLSLLALEQGVCLCYFPEMVWYESGQHVSDADGFSTLLFLSFFLLLDGPE